MRRIQRQNGTQPQLSTSTQDSSANQPPLSIPYEDDVRFPNRQDVQISPCCATCLPQACSGCFNAGWYYQDSCGHICGLPTNYNTDCFPSNRTYCNDLCNYCSCCCNCTPKAETSVRQIQNNPAAETRNIAVGSSPSKIEGPQNQRRTKTLANKAVQSHIEEATGTKPSPRKSIKMIKSGKNIGVQVLTSKQSTVPGPANVGTFQEPVPTRRLNDPSVDTLSIQDFRAFVPTEIDAYPEVGSSLTPTKPVSTASQVLPKFKPPSIFHFEPNTRPRNLPSNPKHSMPTDEPVFKMSEPRADTVIPRPPGFVSSPKIETTSSTPTPNIATLSPTPTPNIGTLSPTPTPNIETISPTPTPNTETLSPTPTPNIATLSPTPTPNTETLSPTPTPNIATLSPTPTPNIATLSSTPTPNIGILSPTPTPNTETLSPTPTPNTETLSSTPTPNIGTLSSTPTPNIESINSTPTPKMVSINSNPTTIIEAESTLRPIIKTKSTPTKNVVTLWTPNTTLDGTRESTFSKIEPSTAKAEGFDEDVVKILTQVLTPIMATIPESSKCSNGMTLTIRLNSKSRTVKPSSSLISKPGKTKSILKQSKTENLSVTASCRSTGCFSGNSKPSKIPSCRSTRYFSGNPQTTPSCRNSTCFGASINSAKTPCCRSKTCFGRNTDLSKSPSCRSSTRLAGKIGTAKTYTSKSSTALDRNLNTPTLHSCRGTGCFSGNTNPPSCRGTSCFSGNTNPTSCRSTSCLGGAINPPTCRSTSCFSGNTNPTSCRSTSCLGGAINPPTCRSTSCFSGNTNPTSCRSTSCFGGAINPPSCHSTSCFGGAIKPATCRSTSCSIGNINPPSCRSTSCSSGNTNPPSCRSTSCSSGNTNPPSCHSISCSSGNTNPPSCHSTSCSSGNHNPPSCHSTSCFGGNTNPPSCRSSACFGGSINPSKMSSCHSITCLDLNSAFIPVCRSTSCNITKQNLSNCETPSCRMHATPVTFSKTGRSNFPASIHTSTTHLPNPDVFHRNPDISAAPTQSMQTSTPDFSMNKLSPPEICRPSFPDIICFRANTSCSCRPSNSTCKCPSSSPKIEYNVPKPSKPRKPHKEPSLNNVPFAPPPKFMKTNQPKPVIPNLQPVIPIPQPVIPIPQPVIPIPQPVIPIPQPVIPIPQPVIPIPQPVIPIPQPVIPIPQPVIPIPKPVIPIPRPVIPNPVIRQPDQPVPSGPPLTSDVTEQPAPPLGYGQPSIRPGYQTSILKKSVTPPPNFGVTPSPTTGYSWPPSAHSSVTSPPPMRSNFGTPLRSGCSVHALNPCDPKKSTSIPSPNCCSPCCPIYVLSQNNCNTVSCPTITDCDKGCILSVPCFDCIETSNGLLCRPNSEELIWNGQPTNTTWSLTFSGKSATRQCNEKNARSYSRKKACRA